MSKRTISPASQGGENAPENRRGKRGESPRSAPPSIIASLNEALASGRDSDLPKGLRDLAASIAGTQATNDPIVELLAYFVTMHLRNDLVQRACLTNDIVEIEGSFAHKASRELRVNSVKINLDRREFVVLYILALHARKSLRQAVPLGASESARFMPVDEILAEIILLKAAHPDLRDLWRDSDPGSIHQIVTRLRKKLVKARLNPFLIECGQPGAGARLSTRPGQIIVILHPAGRHSRAA